MQVFDIVLILMLGVIVSHWLVRALAGRIAAPLVQIAAGAAIGFFSDFGVRLHPDLFFLLFLPPLLFLDGWRVPKESLRQNAATVLSLAVGLVFFTVLGAGLLVHALIPAMPLPVSFALAAILSPTDVVAATAMTQGVSAPPRMLRILEGEALFNDASGLVSLRFAVAATLSGGIAVWPSLADFLWLVGGGVAIGVGTVWLVSMVRAWVVARVGQDSSSQIVLSLLTPFGIYLAADHLGCSSVLAAVAGGMMMSHVEMSGVVPAVTRVRRGDLWETVQFVLNGATFLLLGEQLPGLASGALRSVAESGHSEAGWLGLYTLCLTLGLVALRFAWVWLAVVVSLGRRGRRAGNGAARWPDWRLVATMSAAGVRGTITLAGALSLPLVLPGGEPFPARDLVIFLAGAVIIASLLLANIALPLLLRGLPSAAEPPDDRAESRARIAAARAALEALAQAHQRAGGGARCESGYFDAAAGVSDVYQRRLRALSRLQFMADPVDCASREERRLYGVALGAERRKILSMARSREINGDLARRLVREIDLVEARYESMGG